MPWALPLSEAVTSGGSALGGPNVLAFDDFPHEEWGLGTPYDVISVVNSARQERRLMAVGCRDGRAWLALLNVKLQDSGEGGLDRVCVSRDCDRALLETVLLVRSSLLAAPEWLRSVVRASNGQADAAVQRLTQETLVVTRDGCSGEMRGPSAGPCILAGILTALGVKFQLGVAMGEATLEGTFTPVASGPEKIGTALQKSGVKVLAPSGNISDSGTTDKRLSELKGPDDLLDLASILKAARSRIPRYAPEFWTAVYSVLRREGGTGPALNLVEVQAALVESVRGGRRVWVTGVGSDRGRDIALEVLSLFRDHIFEHLRKCGVLKANLDLTDQGFRLEGRDMDLAIHVPPFRSRKNPDTLKGALLLGLVLLAAGNYGRRPDLVLGDLTTGAFLQGCDIQPDEASFLRGLGGKAKEQVEGFQGQPRLYANQSVCEVVQQQSGVVPELQLIPILHASELSHHALKVPSCWHLIKALTKDDRCLLLRKWGADITRVFAGKDGKGESAHSPSFLTFLADEYDGVDGEHLRWRICRKDDSRPKNLRDLVTYLTNETFYETFEVDVNRNHFFTAAIKALSRDKPRRYWDLGTGRDAMWVVEALKAHENNLAVGLEAVRGVAEKARTAIARKAGKRLKDWQDRATICKFVLGPGHVDPLDTEEDKLPGWNPEVVVAEILGPFASVEGYIAHMHGLREKCGDKLQGLKAAVPARFGTNLYPADLSAGAHKGELHAIGPKLVVFNKLPTDEIKLAEPLAMESYDHLEELKRTSRLLGARVEHLVWTLSDLVEPRPFHGFGSYLWMTDHVGNDVSTNHSTSNPCTNWCNYFLTVGGGEWKVQRGDVIRTTVEAYVDACPEVWFRFDVKVERNGKTDWYHDVQEVSYYDFWCYQDEQPVAIRRAMNKHH